MAVIGALFKKAVGGYGDKPRVPDYIPVDPTEQQKLTVEGNMAVLPQAQELAAKTNKFNLAQLQQMMAGIMPGYHGMQDQISKNIQSGLRGELPADVSRQVQDNAAARAIGGGFAGGGLHRNLEARDFGMTSYGITQQALSSADRWTRTQAATAAPHMMNVTSMFLSPGQRIASAFANTKNQFQRDWMQNQIDAMPDPFRAALGDAFIQDEPELMEMVGSGAGMAMMACWVARAVYGVGTKWKLFRHWLLNIGPKWFRNLYLKYGERFAAWVKDKPRIKSMIRRWMDTKVEVAYESICRCS